MKLRWQVRGIVSWLLQTAVTLGLAVLAFLVMLPTKVGDKYLSFHFDRKLADMRDHQNKEIEKLRGNS
jgi:hypothetical protein